MRLESMSHECEIRIPIHIDHCSCVESSFSTDYSQLSTSKYSCILYFVPSSMLPPLYQSQYSGRYTHCSAGSCNQLSWLLIGYCSLHGSELHHAPYSAVQYKAVDRSCCECDLLHAASPSRFSTTQRTESDPHLCLPTSDI